MTHRAEAFLGRRKTTSPAKFDKHVRFRQTSRVLLVIEPKDVESR